MLEAFAADFLGYLVGSLLDPIVWAVAFGLAWLKSKHQPWLGIGLGVVVSLGLAMMLGQPLTLAFLPQTCARVASVLIPVLIFQAVVRAMRKPKPAQP